MATANDVITEVLEIIGYKAAEVPVEAADANIAHSVLNDMLAEYVESGLKKGNVVITLDNI